MNFDASQLPEKLRRTVELELEPREQILWAERPKVWRWAYARTGKAFRAVPMAVFTGVLAASQGAKDGSFLVQLLAALLFLVSLVCLWDVLSPLRAVREAWNSAYAVTNRRVMLCESNLFGNITTRSFSPACLNRVVCKERRDGTGDLVFAEIWSTDNSFGDNERDGLAKKHRTDIGFLGIHNVKTVEKLLAQMIDAAGPSIEGSAGTGSRETSAV